MALHESGAAKNAMSIELSERQPTSIDTLYEGALSLRQHLSGYRFSIDAVLLAHFVTRFSGARFIDLGTGCGVVLLTLLYRWGEAVQEAVGIEAQASLAGLAAENLASNGFASKGTILHSDFRLIDKQLSAESFDLAVCNPPFFALGSGRANPGEEERLARHQVLGGIDEVFAAAAFLVRNRGAVAIIYPAEKLGEAIVTARGHRLELKRLQLVYSYPHGEARARLALLEYRKNGGGGAEVLPPFYIYQQKNGAFSKEMENFYRANPASAR